MAIGFVIMPFLVRRLGERAYGFWALVGDTLAYYSVFDLGLSSAVGRFVSRSIGQSNAQEASRVASTAYVIFWMVGFVVIVASIGLALLAEHLISDPSERALYRVVILVLGAGLGIGFPVRVHAGILQSLLRYDSLAVASTLRGVLTALLTVVILSRGKGLLALTGITLFGQLCEYGLILFFRHRLASEIVVSFGGSSRQTAGVLFSYSWKAFVAQLADTVRYRVDSAVIAVCVTLSAVTGYVVGARLVEYFNSLLIGALGLLAPVFSRLEGQGDFEGIRRSLRTSLRVSTALSGFCCVCMLVFGRFFIEAWIGPEFGSSYTIMAVLCVPQALALAQSPGIALLFGVSKHQYYMILNVVEALANLLLSLILVGWLGPLGVALGTAVPMLITKGIVQPLVVCRVVDMPLGEYYMRLLGWNAFKSVIPVVVLNVLFGGWLRPALPVLLAGGVAVCLMFLPYAWMFVIGSEERGAVREIWQSMWAEHGYAGSERADGE